MIPKSNRFVLDKSHRRIQVSYSEYAKCLFSIKECTPLQSYLFYVLFSRFVNSQGKPLITFFCTSNFRLFSSVESWKCIKNETIISSNNLFFCAHILKLPLNNFALTILFSFAFCRLVRGSAVYFARQAHGRSSAHGTSILWIFCIFASQVVYTIETRYETSGFLQLFVFSHLFCPCVCFNDFLAPIGLLSPPLTR